MSYKPTHVLVPLRSRPRLNRAMKVRDLNAAELAEIVGTTRQTMSNLRRGRTASTNVHTARAIAEALKVDVATLFDMTDVVDDADVAS